MLHDNDRISRKEGQRVCNVLFSQTSAGTAYWSDLVKLYHVDAMNGAVGLRLAPKLTMSHIYLTLSKTMNVRLAAQLLSHSTSAGKIKTTYLNLSIVYKYCFIVALLEYYRLEKLPLTALGTASVVEKINSMFDLMNSVSTYQKGHKMVITKRLLHQKLQVR